MMVTSGHLADGRQILWFDEGSEPRLVVPDLRDLPATASTSEQRWDPIVGEWVTVASHRQRRTFLPPVDQCPLCPSAEDRRTEIPTTDFQVVVFENRFPSFSQQATVPDDGVTLDPRLYHRERGHGRCEVIVFSDRHGETFATLSPGRVRLVIEAWAERTEALNAMPTVAQVFCFENRGAEIGVTLSHPHGQIYGYPVVTSRTRVMLENAGRYREATGRNLFADVLASERSGGRRVVASNRHWTAFVPAAARWPFEIHLYPHRHVPDLPATDDAERAALAEIYAEILRRLDGVYQVDMPYIAAWHQAPAHTGREDAYLHLELFSIMRAPGKVKALAESESGMGMFINDIAPEHAADLLRAYRW
ncbi:MAG: galactose-1-phosphate uridylyltransferase [Acidobacteriota bacterium]|nr:galactose-1-phosphate uridylyltransferase [Acidobacteriota bacterium]